jgi:dihydrofolate reductase
MINYFTPEALITNALNCELQPANCELSLPTTLAMHLTLIAAVSDNLALGKDNALVWDMPADRAFFREQIRGHLVAMGRLTFESHQGEEPLPYRGAIVITRRKGYQGERAQVAHSLEEAYQLARKQGEEDLFILGGGRIYTQAMADADRLLITEIHTQIDGDAFFPEIDPTQWHEASRASHPADAANPFDYEFVEYRRRPSLA